MDLEEMIGRIAAKQSEYIANKISEDLDSDVADSIECAVAEVMVEFSLGVSICLGIWCLLRFAYDCAVHHEIAREFATIAGGEGLGEGE